MGSRQSETPAGSTGREQIWRVRFTNLLLGVLAGLGGNALYKDLPGYRPVLVIIAVAAVVQAGFRLKKLPPGSRLVRYSSRVALSSALASAAAAAVVPRPWDVVMVLVAAGFTALAIVLAAGHAAAVTLLVSAGGIGCGVACLSAGIGFLIQGYILVSIPIVVLGASFGVLAAGGEDSRKSIAAVLFGSGACIVIGIALLKNGQLVPGFAIVTASVGCLMLLRARLTGSTYGVLAAGLTAMTGLVIYGATTVYVGRVAEGIGEIGLGLTSGGRLLAAKTGPPEFKALMGVGMGLACASLGIAPWNKGDVLPGAAFMGLGLAFAVNGISDLIRTGAFGRLQMWLISDGPPSEQAAISVPAPIPDLVSVAAKGGKKAAGRPQKRRGGRRPRPHR